MIDVADLLVRRLRVSYISAIAHDRLRTVGEQEAFARLLLQPQPVAGLGDVSLPFPADQPPGGDANWLFWSHIAERPKLQRPQSLDEARKLARAGVPLRHAASILNEHKQVVGVREDPRMKSIRQALAAKLEIQIVPFGVAAIATIDLAQPVPAPLDQTMDDLDAMAAWTFFVSVGDFEVRTHLNSIAAKALEMSIDVLGEPQGETWDMPAHRVVTVIDAENSELSEEIPAPSGRYHRVAHRLADGGPNLAEPLTAFVPRWTNSSFSWSAAEWVYMLDRGSSVITRAALQPNGLRGSTSFKHRGLCLLIAHVSTSGALIKGGKASDSPYFSSWAKIAADRLGRLYGPNTPGNDYWGLETRQLVRVTGLADAIAKIKGQPVAEMFPGPKTYP